MRTLSRTCATALTATALLLGGAAPAPAAPAAGYAALGDSYAAGVGAGGYDPAAGDCHRSANAYPVLWAAAHPGTAATDLACNGADTHAVLTDQLPKLPHGLARVSLTVGGNDLGFTDAVLACLQPLTTDERCDRALAHSADLLDHQLPSRYDQLLTALTAAAPDARVVVTGYPDLLATEASGLCWTGTGHRRAEFNALTDRVDELIHRQATAHGARFADPRPAFAGHGVCAGPGGEWITGIVLRTPWESFHPTAEGQSHGYLPVVSDALS
ncbi:SGNH/GDSL hydrolase family protein [Kitasatospora viridis]|uniref:GDSL-like lipase/acylhydrolase family protein n=1 Tax=Kitasatospora viridis TaxID=281105 RepID=A0A561UNG5_9ACTN|nr:SGNH/GDSL hydrolase family protein [Kitasatospora viridis]TWG00909.1 GDSL-like lipase/acylhydrolase family protein [Kitasatospora viridis]